MLVRAFVDDFAVEDKYMSPPDASEEAAVAGLLCLNGDEKPGESKQPATKQAPAQIASKAGKRSAPAADGCDSATQTDSVTLTDGANDCREREVDSGCGNGSDAGPKQRKRQKTGAKVPSNKTASTAAGSGSARRSSEGENNTAPSSTVPFTLASAAQAAGVWNRSAARPMIPKMPTMMSATDTNTPHRPSNTGHVTPFEGCEGGAVVKDSVEHADDLHRESGADPISHDQQRCIAQQQHADLTAFLNESATRTIPPEALHKLLQQCATGGQLSITDLVRAMQQSSQVTNGTEGDDATNFTHATHTSTVSTREAFPAPSCDTRATPHGSHMDTRNTEAAAASQRDNTAPVSAKARSLFVQLSDMTGGTDAAKVALERTATPIVPRSAGPPPHMPMHVGPGPHRTRSSSGAPRGSSRPSAQSLTTPLPAYRQHIGHAVAVTSHQKHQSDLLNNPESRNQLWFPEKSRNAKNKTKFPNTTKRAADNKQQGLAAERLVHVPGDSSGSKSALPSSAPSAQDLRNIASSLAHVEVKSEQQQVSELPKPVIASKSNLGGNLPITPERVEGLLSLVSQLAVFADGGVSGVWCRSLHNADCAPARSLFRRALELQGKGTTPSHIAPLLTSQANVAAAIAAYAAAGGSRVAHKLGLRGSIPPGLQAAAANAVTSATKAQKASYSAPSGAAAVETATPAKRCSPQRKSSAVASAH